MMKVGSGAASADAVVQAQSKQESGRQEAKQATPGLILEVGAGTGAFTPLFRGLGDLSDRYVASDIGQNSPGSPYFSDLRDPDNAVQSRLPGVEIKDQVDANQLGLHFRDSSVDLIVGANAYGDLDVPGASYGLMKSTGDKRADFVVDTRLAEAAQKVLKPGGQVRLFGRCNTMHSFLKKSWGQREKIKPKQVNRFMDISKDQLTRIAALGFKVDVYPATQPDNIKGRRPDTHADSIGKQQEGRKLLGEYNTEFVLTKNESGEPGEIVFHDESDGAFERLVYAYDQRFDGASDVESDGASDVNEAASELDKFLLAEQDRSLFGGF